MTERTSTSAMGNSREKLVAYWKDLHPIFKILGCVIFAWAAWRTVPIINVVLQLVVLAVGLLFLIACIGASEETMNLLNNYRRECINYMRSATSEEESQEEESDTENT